MTFVFGNVLWLFVGIPVVGVLLLVSAYQARRTVSLFVGEGRRTVVLNRLVVKNFVVAVLFTGAVASLIVALAGPQWGEVSVEDERRGLDLVFLVDVSNSMSAQDVPTSRLGRSREVARALAGRLSGAYKAVVAFKGSATVVVPMTEDPVAFDLAIGNLSGALITSAGTSLQTGIRTALDAFPPGSPRHRAIVLFSDGEELQDAVNAELQRLRDAGIPIFSVVTGTRDGATIPLRNGGVLRDAEGRPVIVGVDRPVMAQLAEVSGGAVYDISDSGVTQRIAGDLTTLAGTGRDVVFREVAVDRYHLFAVLALLFLVGIVLVQNAPWRRQL